MAALNVRADYGANMRKLHSPTEKRRQKSARLRRSQAAARRTRRLFAEWLEPRHLLAQSVMIEVHDTTIFEPNHDWELNEPISSGLVARITATRTGTPEPQDPPSLTINWTYTGTANNHDFFVTETLIYGSSGSSGLGYLTLGPSDVSKDFYFVADADGAYEDTETMSMDFSYDGSVIKHADFTIADNSQYVTLTASQGEVSEGGEATFTVTRHNWQGQAGIGVLLAISGSPNLKWTDHNLGVSSGNGGNFTRFIPDNEASHTFTLSPKEDCLYEGNETFTLTLVLTIPGTAEPFPQPAYRVDTPNTASMTILDDDLPPWISISDGGGQEGTEANPGSAIFPVSIECATAHGPLEPIGSDYPLTIIYSTQDDTGLTYPATAGQDYETASNIQIPNFSFFPAPPLLIPLIHDTRDEYDEKFYVTLNSAQFSNGQSANIVDNQALGTIFDNDNPPTISIGSVTVSEEEQEAFFPVELSSPTEKVVSGTYKTVNGTAFATTVSESNVWEFKDYTGIPSTLIEFEPGETLKIIPVQIEADGLTEGNEHFSVELSDLDSNTVSFGTTIGIGTITDNDKPDDIPRSCSSCSSSGLGSLIGDGAQGVASSFASPGLTSAPVRYADGTVLIVSTDIQADSFGMPWGVTRSWTNGEGYAPPNVVGKGMMISEQPYLRSFDSDNEIAVITNSMTAHYFDLVQGFYVSRFFLQERLEKNNSANEFVLTDTTGAQIRFHDFSTNHPESQRGQFKSYKDPNGKDTTTVYANGKLTEVRRSNVEDLVEYTDSFLYSYIASGMSSGLLSSVEYKRGTNGGGWVTRQAVTYAYYGINEPFGNPGDLKTATVTYVGGGSDTTYYRYYKLGDPNGYRHGLKFVFSPTSYARLAADIVNPTTAADNVVDDYADHYFEYDQLQRATKEIAQGTGCSCSAGMGTFTFAYDGPTSFPSHAEGPNSWSLRTTETLPDGNKNVVYTNEYGQVMLEAFWNTTTNEKWATYYRYDDDGRVVIRADPSALLGYSESFPDLVGFNAEHSVYIYLNDDSGLITDFDYYDEEETGPGEVFGYLESVKVREGYLDPTPSEQSRYTYVGRTINAHTVFFIATSSVFEEDDGAAELKTTYAYSGSQRIEQVAIQNPTHALNTVVYDTFGRSSWIKDAAGFIHHTVYVPGSNAVSQMITDVNTSLVTGAPWTTPAEGGSHIIAEFIVDQLNRPATIYDPNDHQATIAYDNAARQTTFTGEIGPSLVSRDDRARGYVESSVWAVSGMESLGRTYFNNAGQVTHVDDFFNFAGLTYGQATNLGQENVHFYRTSFAYDQRGRLNRTQRPDGVIYRTVYDGLGRPISEWIGTDDTPTTGTWSPTNTAGTNLVLMQLYVYDNGGIGDSHLTSTTDALGRTTTFLYDYLGRVTKVTLPDPDPTVTGDIPDYETTYDNLGRVKTRLDPFDKVTSYNYVINTTTHQTTVTVTLPDPDAGGDLLSPVLTSLYDARGLLFSQTDPEGRVTAYEYDGAGRLINVTQVNPGATSLETVYQYDDAGNLRFITDPADNQTERLYDALNRLTDVYAPDPDGPSNPLERPHTQYAYDTAGRLLSLTDPVGSVTSWFYDPLGRVTQEANHIGHSRYFEYDAASRLDKRTDRLGRIIEFDYNNLDQVTQERWYDAVEEETLVRTLTHNYDTMGQLLGASDPAATYTYLHDGLGRLKTETQTFAGFSPSGPGGPQGIEYTSTYNKAGSRESLRAAIGYYYDFLNYYQYDHLQRLIGLTQISQGPAANTVAPKRIEFAYNAAGQFKTIGRYADTGSTELVANTFYKYDPVGRLESMIHSEDATAPASGWGAAPLAGYMYFYDAANRLDSISSLFVLDGIGQTSVTSYDYDNTNQLTAADHDAQSDESYSYDANGNRTGGGYFNDVNNRIQSDGTFTYFYDLEGNRVEKLNYATGVITKYEYDHRNRLVRVQDIDPTHGRGINWGWGESSISVGYEVTESLGYQELGGQWNLCSGDPEECQLVSFQVIVYNALEGESVTVSVNSDWPIEYTIEQPPCVPEPEAPCMVTVPFHAVGHPETLNDVVGYIFDPADQSTEWRSYGAYVSSAVEGSDLLLVTWGDGFAYYVEDRSAQEAVDYDDPNDTMGGVWTYVGESGQVVIPTANRPGYQGTRSFAIHVMPLSYLPFGSDVLEADIHDTEENIIQSVDYSYDVYNQLVHRQLDEDGPHEPILPADSFFSWQNGQIVFQFDGPSSAEPAHRYLFNPLAIDHILADENALNEVLWPLTDHLGTPRDLVTYDLATHTSTIANHRVFDSFGILISQSNTNFQTAFGFTGVYFDTATSLNYHRNRWYDPAIGKWINEDPMGLVPDTNPYRYVHNVPVSRVDPLGLDDFGSFAEDLQGGAGDPVKVAAALGIGQGGLNSLNGIQDAAIGIINSGRNFTPVVDIMESISGADLTLTSPDWSRNRLVHEGDWSHSTSKFVGGEGVITLCTFGAGQARHADKVRFLPWLTSLQSQRATRFAEFMHFRNQGFSPARAKYLMEPYVGSGHHFPITQAAGQRMGLPNWILNSQFNVLKPNGMSRGRFYELHYAVDPCFQRAGFPRHIGGDWIGKRIGLEKYDLPGQLWFGTPLPTRMSGAAGAGALGGMNQWLNEDE